MARHISSFRDLLPEPEPIGSYSRHDVVFLLKNINNLICEQDNAEREHAIQSGRHYSEMLPIEYNPSKEYIDLFYSSLSKYSFKLAVATGVVSELIIKRKKSPVLVSLARAGTPAGILIKRYIKYKYKKELPHYSISIIRDRGIDENAVKYILAKHPDSTFQFIDGWTGKGTITRELIKACDYFNRKYSTNLSHELAVLADPGLCAHIYGTREDFLIPSSCLNSTVSGLVSRTVLRDDIIGPNDFHGVKYYKELEKEDVSNLFIDTIAKEYPRVIGDIERELINIESQSSQCNGLEEVSKIKNEFQIDDVNFIKPGVGETTRVLLRRIPWKILVRDKTDPDLEHILLLAQEKGVITEVYPLSYYKCCGIIKSMKDT